MDIPEVDFVFHRHDLMRRQLEVGISRKVQYSVVEVRTAWLQIDRCLEHSQFEGSCCYEGSA